MANKGIPKFPLFDPFSQKMSCPLFGVPTVVPNFIKNPIRKTFVFDFTVPGPNKSTVSGKSSRIIENLSDA